MPSKFEKVNDVRHSTFQRCQRSNRAGQFTNGTSADTRGTGVPLASGTVPLLDLSAEPFSMIFPVIPFQEADTLSEVQLLPLSINPGCFESDRSSAKNIRIRTSQACGMMSMLGPLAGAHSRHRAIRINQCQSPAVGR